MTPYKLETEQLTKYYPGTVALKDFSAQFQGGEVHALVGKNGSGKSTVVKIFAGAIKPTSGVIKIDGQAASINSPQDAFDNGIATVYQELSVIPSLTVGENILLGRLPKRKMFVNWDDVFSSAQAILDSTGASNISAKALVRDLSVGQRQVVEIAKAYSFKPAVILLDEPTSALARHETESLFGVIHELKKKGVAILYITHRLQELNKIADKITVLRDGVRIGTIPIQEATPAKLVDMMFGGVVQKQRPTHLKVRKKPVLEVRHLSREHAFQDISFTLHEGEILGIAGMLGSGRTELLRAIFGADPFDVGEIIVEGKQVLNPDPVVMKMKGVALTPESRKEQGLVQMLSTRENLCLANLDRIVGKRGLVSKRIEQELVQSQIRNLQIKVPNLENPVSTLSGGNQQKVVVGNWLNTKPRVVLFDEPSRGIDVNAKQQIFQIMWNLSEEGISSLFVTTELEELLEVCHRILVMQHGSIVAEVVPEQTDLEQLYALAMGAQINA
jgi:ribose transport system ATP-binding protein